MPTASTANILGNTEGFEPIPSNIYKRNVLSGEFVRINRYLVQDLIELGPVERDETGYHCQRRLGAAHRRYPQRYQSELYRTVWEIKQRHIMT